MFANGGARMNTDTIIVTLSIEGQPGVIDVEIPDDRPLHDTVHQLVGSLNVVDLRQHQINKIEVVDAYTGRPRNIERDHTPLLSSIHDGDWLIVHVGRLQHANMQGQAPDLTVLPTASQSSSAIGFQKRRIGQDGNDS